MINLLKFIKSASTGRILAVLLGTSLLSAAALARRVAEPPAPPGRIRNQAVRRPPSWFEVTMAADDLVNARRAAEAATRVHAAEQTQARARQDLSVAEQRRQLAALQAELREARFTLKEARLRYDSARSAMADAFVRAPRAGAVLECLVHAGDRIPAGTLLAKMAPLDPVAVDVDVPPNVVNLLRT